MKIRAAFSQSVRANEFKYLFTYVAVLLLGLCNNALLNTYVV